MTLEQKIRILSADTGVSFTQIAEALGTSPSSLSQRLKRGTFRKRDLEKIAKACNCEYYCGFDIDGDHVE